jgi:hypothetical protein
MGFGISSMTGKKMYQQEILLSHKSTYDISFDAWKFTTVERHGLEERSLGPLSSGRQKM